MDQKVDTRLRFRVISGLLVAAAFVASYSACWGLLSPASRAAKCWVQLDGEGTSIIISATLGVAGIGLWIGGWLLARNAQVGRGVLLATFVTVPVLAITLLPFVLLGAYPLNSELTSNCDGGALSGFLVSAAAIAPLLGILILAIVFRVVMKPTSRP